MTKMTKKKKFFLTLLAIILTMFNFITVSIVFLWINLKAPEGKTFDPMYFTFSITVIGCINGIIGGYMGVDFGINWARGKFYKKELNNEHS